MPPRSKKPCRAALCGLTTTDPRGYCDKHKAQSSGWAKPGRKSAEARGYDWAWRKLAASIAKRDRYLCVLCLARGLVAPYASVDHKVSKADGGDDDPSNLQSLCGPCHDAKTALEAKKAREGYGYR